MHGSRNDEIVGISGCCANIWRLPNSTGATEISRSLHCLGSSLDWSPQSVCNQQQPCPSNRSSRLLSTGTCSPQVCTAAHP